ncbi:hypothetical protein BT67DRAFT_85533, partial [Trichocladium antarcticum]
MLPSELYVALYSVLFIVVCWIAQRYNLVPEMASVLQRALFPPPNQPTASTVEEDATTGPAWLAGSTALVGSAKGVPAAVQHDQDIAKSTRSSVEVTTQQALECQDKGKRKAGGEGVLKGEEEEVDILAYPPPDSLVKFPSSAPETIKTVIQSALENVTQQARIEKERVETAAVQVETSLQRDAEEDAKGKARAITDTPELTVPSINVADAVDPTPDAGPTESMGDEGSLKSTGRPRSGLRRIFHHLVEKGETRGETSAQTYDMLPSGAGDVADPPSPFTQFIYKHLHAKPSQRADQDSEEAACVSCFEELPPKALIKTACHPYCKVCFNLLITTAINNPAQWPPKCCLNPIPHRTITKHATRNLAKNYKLKQAEFAQPGPDRLYCPTPDCGIYIAPRRPTTAHTRKKHTARCARGHRTCLACGAPAHPTPAHCPRAANPSTAAAPEEIAEIAEIAEIDRLAAEEGWRRCPDCGILVEHGAACQHMTCPCGGQFCYVCGARWRTCACTAAQLDGIKALAGVRR